MIAPTDEVRTEVYFRDGNQCAACGRRTLLTFQHRAAVGSGGSKIHPTYEEGLTLCNDCNGRAERDRQAVSLARGWKVRRWVQQQGKCNAVPVFYEPIGAWFRLDGTERIRITDATAIAMMHAVYGRAEYERWELAA